MKITIVEDDIKLREELKKFLINNGYEIELITNFSNLIDDLNKTSSDLILLDLNLPNIDGKFICKKFRSLNSTPIIILTSSNSEIDEILSMNYGADDYIIKPYNPQILILHIEAVLKRLNPNSLIIPYQNIQLDVSKSIIKGNNKIIDLSKNEVKILFYLLKNQGKIVSREEIMSYLWDSEMFVDDNTLTVNINRLRNKLALVELENVIETKRGQGYIIT